MAAEPTVQRIGESWWAIWPSHGLALEFARLTDHRDTLSAELTVTSESLGTLHWSRVNLASASGRSQVVKALEEVCPGLPWRTVLDRSSQRVAIALRVTEPAVALVPTAPTPAAWLVDRWLPLRDITVVYGDGGTGKSLFALALAISGLLGYALGGPWRVGPLTRVLYLDWETTQATHEGRLWGLVDHLPYVLEPGAVIYRRLRRALTDELASVRADMDRHHPDFVITDSLGAAAGPEPEGADAAVRTLTALGSLPATHLVLAHVSKASADLPRAKPYGSVYVQNLARSTIEVRAQDSEAPDELTVTYRHEKSNNGPKARPSALTYAFDGPRIGISATEPDPTAVTLPVRVLKELRSGPQTVACLAELTDSSEATIRSTLGRLAKRGKVIQLATVSGGRGKESQWGRVDINRGTVDA